MTELSRLGCKVLATARGGEELQELWDKDPNVEWMAADLCQSGVAQSLVDKAVSTFGKLDGLVNNAGSIEPIAPLSNCDAEAWAKAIEVNLTAPAILMGAALPHLKKSGGKILNISSGAAVKVVQGWSAYCTAKAGLLHLTKIAAAENPALSFFSLRPGVVDTQMQSEIRNSQGMTQADLAKFQKLKDENQLEPPSVPARSAAWLVLHGPLERSGEFIEYSDEEVIKGVEKLFTTKGRSS